MHAIVAATSLNAEILNMQDQIGSVTAGKLADLIAVSGQPLDDDRHAPRRPLRDESRRRLQRRVVDQAQDAVARLLLFRCTALTQVMRAVLDTVRRSHLERRLFPSRTSLRLD